MGLSVVDTDVDGSTLYLYHCYHWDSDGKDSKDAAPPPPPVNSSIDVACCRLPQDNASGAFLHAEAGESEVMEKETATHTHTHNVCLCVCLCIIFGMPGSFATLFIRQQARSCSSWSSEVGARSVLLSMSTQYSTVQFQWSV